MCPRTAGWQGNTIRRGAQRPKNRVTRFTPWQRWCRKAPKGEKPPQVANSAGEEQRHETHCGRGRRLAVSYAIECHGGAMPRTPFCCFAALSLKGKQEIELENLCVKCALCHSGGSPFGGCATTFLHGKACHWILARLLAPYESSSFATPQAVGQQSSVSQLSQKWQKL